MTAQIEQQLSIFNEWLNGADVPASYDRDMLKSSAIDNATDVPVEKLAEVAIDTASMYLDDESMAREAGIVGYWD